MALKNETKAYLLSFARETIKSKLENTPPPEKKEVESACNEKRGTFVTLHNKDGTLRGCIGYVMGVKSVLESVSDMAINAAFNDPRFPPLAKDELANIVIEITILTIPRKVESLDEIEVGRHGLIASLGFNKGLLLPQVPVEYGWSKDEFLSHTCLKASLPADAWKSGTLTFECFEGEVFSEKDFL